MVLTDEFRPLADLREVPLALSLPVLGTAIDRALPGSLSLTGLRPAGTFQSSI
jgi:hypothetical protein